ncbi:hypothetical protein D3C74_365420 [compost metagenome]
MLVTTACCASQAAAWASSSAGGTTTVKVRGSVTAPRVTEAVRVTLAAGRPAAGWVTLPDDVTTSACEVAHAMVEPCAPVTGSVRLLVTALVSPRSRAAASAPAAAAAVFCARAATSFAGSARS